MPSSSVTSPEDVINLALVRIGYKTRIGSIWEGSLAAKKALDCYAQTRDAMLRAFDWGFAERNVALTLIKQAPVGGYVPPNTWSSAYPPPPWLAECVYPVDCLKVRSVKNVPMFVPNFSPQPYLFSVDNDPSLSEPSKVVLCNVYPGILVYTGQITNCADWEPDYTEALASALGRRLAIVLDLPNAAQMAGQDEQVETLMAEDIRG